MKKDLKTVYKMVISGMTSKQIAERLGVSIGNACDKISDAIKEQRYNSISHLDNEPALGAKTESYWKNEEEVFWTNPYE